MNKLAQDILSGMTFITGLISFLSGEFILSSALFASATIISHLNIKSPNESENQPCEQ
ncbi:MAG: hypothetical protein RQ715_11500 [Methylococcales bacterium]|nr:hypothetical protein [Methylococcales bacterium]